MPQFPKGYTKAMLLSAVEAVNDVAGTNLRVKSKTCAGMVNLIAAAMKDVDHVAVAEDLGQDHMETLIAFNIIKDFIDEDTYSKKLIAALKSVDSDTAQADEPVVYNDEAADVDEKKEKSQSKKDKKEKKKGKKGKKLEELANEVDDEEDDDEEKDSDPTPRQVVEQLEGMLAVDGLGKKDKKKIKKQLKAARAAVDAEDAEEAEKPELTKKEKKAAEKAAKKAAKEAEKAGGGSKGNDDKPSKPKVGVIATILTILQDSKDYLTAEEILQELTERLPAGNPDTMIKTVKAQLYCREAPCRMEKEKGVEIKIKGAGADRSFKAK